MSGVEGSPENRAQGSGQGSAQGSAGVPDPDSNQAPGELSSRTRMVILVFAVVVGVLVAAVPVVISLSDAPSQAPSTSSAVGSDAAGGGAQDGAGDGSGSGSTAGSDGGNADSAASGGADAGSSDGGKTGGQAGVELSGVRLPYLSVAGRQVTGNTGAGGASSGGTESGSTGSAGAGSGGAAAGGAGSGGASSGGQGSDETVDLGEALQGKVSIVNVWAWWCGPCRQELPVLSQAAAKHPEWNVVGVHSAKEAQAGVDFLKELRATDLTTYQDSNHVFDTATNIPKVVPITLVYRADGTRAGLLPRTFHTVEELEQAVQEALGAPEGGGA